MLVPVTVIIHQIVRNKRIKLISKEFTKIKSKDEFSLLFLTLKDLIITRNKENSAFLLFGFLKKNESIFKSYTQQYPELVHVVTRIIKELSENNLNKDLEDTKFEKYEASKMTADDEEKEEYIRYAELEKYDYFLLNVLRIGLDMHPASSKLMLLLALFEIHHIKYYWMGLYSLMRLSKIRSSSLENFMIFRAIVEVQLQVISENKTQKRETGFDATFLLNYQKEYFNFMRKISDSLKLYLQFWVELDDKAPETDKLIGLGSVITKMNNEISEKFTLIKKTQVTNMKLYRTYAGFLEYVSHDEEGLKLIEEKIIDTSRSVLSRNFLKSEADFKFESVADDSTTIFTVSGDNSKMGEILTVSNQVADSLGYKPAELIGDNINHIMPKFYSDRHVKFMNRFFKSGQAKVMNKKRIVFPRTSLGYLKPCNLRLLVMPYLNKGVRMVGILSNVDMKERVPKDLENDVRDSEIHHVLFNRDTGEIIGVSESCNRNFGLNGKLFTGELNSNKLDITSIFPSFFGSNLEEFDEGIVETVIDTSFMKDNHYFLAMNKSEKINVKKKVNLGEEEDYEEDGSLEIESESQEINISEGDEEKFEELNKKFKETNVTSWLSLSEIYDREEICCLSFYESQEQDEEDGRAYKEMFHQEEMNSRQSLKRTVVIYIYFNFRLLEMFQTR